MTELKAAFRNFANEAEPAALTAIGSNIRQNKGDFFLQTKKDTRRSKLQAAGI